MNAPRHRRRLDVRAQLNRRLPDLVNWRTQPSFDEVRGQERHAVRAAAVECVRDLEAAGVPTRLAITLVSIRHRASEISIKRWIRAAKTSPAGAVDVPVRKSPGRPPRAWSAPGMEDAFGLYCVLYGCSAMKSSAEVWRAVHAIARARGLTIPCERMFRLRLARETAPGR